MIFLLVLLIIFLLLLIYFFLCFTHTKRENRFTNLTNKYIAHRGLFNNKDIPENSITAYKLAVENNFGIELDVHITKDKVPVIIHDSNLLRMCGVDVNIEDITYKESQKYNLLNTDEKIPMFSDVLKIIDGKVPLFVEIKEKNNAKEIASITANLLNTYSGPYAVQCFNPFPLLWFKRYKPEVIRGQLATNFIKSDNKIIKKISVSNMIFDFLSKPDYIAYNYKEKENYVLKLIKKLTNTKIQVWAIKNQKDFDRDKDNYDIVLFDSFIPKL